MKIYELKFNKSLNESKNQFINLQKGEIVQIPPQILWHRDGTGFHKAETHATDFFIVIYKDNEKASLVTDKDYYDIVKFLHLRGDDLEKAELDYRDYILSKDEVTRQTLYKDSLIECDCIYEFNPNINFITRGSVKDITLVDKVLQFINDLILNKEVYINLETDNTKDPIKQDKPINESLFTFKPYRYINNESNFMCQIKQDEGDYISGTIKFKGINYLFGYDYGNAFLELQDSTTDGTISIYYNYDDTYELNHNDTNLDNNNIDLLANCFIDVIVDYDRFNVENNVIDY